MKTKVSTILKSNLYLVVTLLFVMLGITSVYAQPLPSCDPPISGPVILDGTANFCAPSSVLADRVVTVNNPGAGFEVRWVVVSVPAGSNLLPGQEYTTGTNNNEIRVDGTNGTRLGLRVRANGQFAGLNPPIYGTWVFDAYLVDISNNCVSQITSGFNLTSRPTPVANAGSYGPFCENAGAQTLTGSPAGAGGVWGPNVLTALTDNGDGTASFDPEGLLSVSPVELIYTYTNAEGCSDSDTTYIEILESPAITINNVTGFPNSPVCEGVQAAFLASPTAGGTPPVQSYLWAFSGAPEISGLGQTAVDGTRRQQRIIWNSSSSYTVDLSVEFTNGCISVAPQRIVVVNENPTASILPASVDRLLCPREQFEFSGIATGGEEPYNFSWADAENFDDPESQNPTFLGGSAGLYDIILTVTDDNGCIAEATVSFEVGDTLNPSITCPSDFTIFTEPGTCEGIANYGIIYSDNCSGTSYYGFTGAFAPANWIFTNSPDASGSVDISGAPSSIVLTGSNGANSSDPLESSLCITIPGTGAGMLSFSWQYATLDTDGPFFDPFGYSIDGTFTQLSDNLGGSNQSGFENIMLNPGQEFCYVARTVDNIFGASITIAMNFEYMEGMGLTLSQTLGLASGELIPLGPNTFEFFVIDAFENTATCSFVITVVDNEAPQIFCPENINIELPPLTCESLVEFNLDFSDNCPGGGPIVKLDGTGLDSGDLFPIGIYTLSYGVADGAGNFASCSFTVTVNDLFNTDLACKHVNYSFDQNCGGEVTADMVLAGEPLGCLDAFIITIFDKFGNPVGNTPQYEMLGQTLMYMVEHPVIDFICMGTIKIEDKLAPSIVCIDDVISCMAGLETAILPRAIDNCEAHIVLVDLVEEKINCDPEFLGRITRIWKAVDKYGNESGHCAQRIDIARTDLSSLTWPSNFMGSDALTCNTFALDADGNPHPSVTGVPRLNGTALFPFNAMQICNGYVFYRDHVEFSADCKKRITRTWEVGEWWCSSTNYRIHVQVLEVVDKVAPTISGISDMTVSTQGHFCQTLVNLPAAIVTDNCNTAQIEFISTGHGVIYTNGGSVVLPSGIHDVVYTARDACGNQSTRTIQVTVLDRSNPIAICRRTTVSITADGSGYVASSSINDGSFDECGPVTVKIRRVLDECGVSGTDWQDNLYFCCADVGKNHMVELLVTDQSNNVNTCMVLLEVQDKLPGFMVCPGDMQVECNYPYDPANLSNYFGSVQLFDNCPSNLILDDRIVEDRDQCGIGKATRTIRLFEQGVNTQTCIQYITFESANPFGYDNIQWPESFTTTADCTMLDLHPDNLPVGRGRPIIEDFECSLAGASLVEEHVINFSNSGNCFKILRKWAVIDWCGRTSSGELARWEGPVQEILVLNTVGPVITSSEAFRFECTFDNNCADGFITLLASASDDCTAADELVWSWRIDLDQNGSWNRFGSGNNASGSYPVGLHRVEFTVLDRCGNFNITTYDFEVRSCKAPTARCLQGLTAPLVAMDMSGDGNPDTEMVDFHAWQLDNKSDHACYTADQLQLSFSADVNDVVRTFSCDDIGEVQIQMWVTAPNGEQSFCNTYIVIVDNNNVDICPAGGGRFNVSGLVSTPYGDPIQEVEVLLVATESSKVITEESGQYLFENLPAGLQLELIPTKNDDLLNGISTIDLVLIQRHILGLQKLDDPYKIIAADVNNSGSVTAADLVLLRRVILGTATEFTNSGSWRFFDAAFEINDPEHPLQGLLPESYQQEDLQHDEIIDFTGVKVGDVNWSASTGLNSNNTEIRSAQKLVFNSENQFLTAGKHYSIPVYNADGAMLFGTQFELMTSKFHSVKLTSGLCTVYDNDYIDNNSILRASIAAPYGIASDIESPLFFIDIVSNESAMLADLLRLNTGYANEAYVTEALEIRDLELSFVNIAEGFFTAGQNEPNPWKDITSIPVTIPSDGVLKIKLFDSTGKLLSTDSKEFTKGSHNLTISAERLINVPAGVVLCELEFNNTVVTKKMIYIK